MQMVFLKLVIKIKEQVIIKIIQVTFFLKVNTAVKFRDFLLSG